MREYGKSVVLMSPYYLALLAVGVLILFFACDAPSARKSFVKAYNPNSKDQTEGEGSNSSEQDPGSTSPDEPDDAPQGNDNNHTGNDGDGKGDIPDRPDWISGLKGKLVVNIGISHDVTFADSHPNYRTEHNFTEVSNLWQYGWVTISIDVPFRYTNQFAVRSYLRYFKYDDSASPEYIIPYWQRECVDDFPILSMQQVNVILYWIQECGLNWEDPESPYRVNPFGTEPSIPTYANLSIEYFPVDAATGKTLDYLFGHGALTYEEYMTDKLIRGSAILLSSYDCFFGDFANMPWEGFIGYYDPEKL